MSVGHRTGSGAIEPGWLDEQIAEIGELTRLDHSKYVPLGGGSSKDGTIIYMDSRIPKTFRQRNGKECPVFKFLMIHEWWEKRAIDAGMKYTPAHSGATAVELTAVQDEGYSVKEYDDFWDHWLLIVEKTELGDGTPEDLDMHAYEND